MQRVPASRSRGAGGRQRAEAQRRMAESGPTEAQQAAARAALTRFTLLNTLAFEVLAGQVALLYARRMGASLADLGMLVALWPLSSVVQVLATPLVSRFGPRAVVLAGWSARTVAALGLLLVPSVAAARGGPAGVQVLLLTMVLFALCRAVGGCAWTSLVRSLVPDEAYGPLAGRLEWVRQAAVVIVNIVAAACLAGQSGLAPFLVVIG